MNRYVYNGTVKKQDNGDKAKEDRIYYKVLNPDWTRLGYQYQLGGTYSIPERDLVLCKCGFHCCEHPIECLEFYELNPLNHYVEVKMLGKIVPPWGYDSVRKYATSIIRIEREIPYEDWLELCTVTESRGIAQGYEEREWVKGKLSESRCFYRNGSKRLELVFANSAISKRISYFPNGKVKLIQTRSDLSPDKKNLIIYYPNGQEKVTELWVQQEGAGGAVQCMRNTYDEKRKSTNLPLFLCLSCSKGD
jgi:hypothetical protein